MGSTVVCTLAPGNGSLIGPLRSRTTKFYGAPTGAPLTRTIDQYLGAYPKKGSLDERAIAVG